MTNVQSRLFFFNDTATTEIYTLSLHDALPISAAGDHLADVEPGSLLRTEPAVRRVGDPGHRREDDGGRHVQRPEGERSEEHTSELQSRQYLVCRLLLETKKSPIRALRVLHELV